MIRTSSPAASLSSSREAIRIPTSPSRQPNISTCTDERAASRSANTRGKKRSPSTQGSIVAAVDHANGSAALRGPAPSRAVNASTACCAAAEVTASAPGGQLGCCVMRSTRWPRPASVAANSIPATVRAVPRICSSSGGAASVTQRGRAGSPDSGDPPPPRRA